MKIKQLVWTQLPGYQEPIGYRGEVTGYIDVEGWYLAKAPSTGKEYRIHKEPDDDLFYPLWDCMPGFELLEDAKAAAQAEFETDIMEALDA